MRANGEFTPINAEAINVSPDGIEGLFRGTWHPTCINRKENPIVHIRLVYDPEKIEREQCALQSDIEEIESMIANLEA